MTNSFQLIEERVQRMQFSREIFGMADALMYALQIPHGRALVPFLAPSRALDNREAIAVWLRRELDFPNVDVARLCVAELLPLLKRRLMEIEEECA